MHFTDYHTRLSAYVLLVDDQERALLAELEGQPRSEIVDVAIAARDKKVATR